ncbi:hypothetical protein E2F50_00140 [Rhizobium deserti]|uniref:Lysozyme n=1 Tax=Rhizobium deserti TaxID=2547961 RepID=A0A4V3APP9_9HYPH|nr:hypothetical protein [Rhizobium deserti]TDK38610.1 hypothetical protein E2F50_00140 [Rhizobium deserti]
MPATDEERLIVSVEARITDIERNMRKAERTTTQSFQGMRRSSRSATQQMEQDTIRSTQRINQALAQTSTRIGSFGKAFVGGLAVGAAVGALEGIRQAAVEGTKSVLEMSDQAKRAGLSFRAFQELKFVSEQNRIDVDSLTDGLKELSLRADEFIKTGAGSSAEAFQRLGYDAQTLATKLKQPDQLFLEIIGKLQRLDKAAQIRIADEVFGGTGGEKFVQLIGKGEQGIRQQIKAANDLGVVLDDEMIAKAERVNQKFDAIATTISTKVKGAIVEAVAAWMDFINSAAAPSIAVDPNDRVAAEQKLRDIENDTSLNSRAKAAALGAQRRELARIDSERAAIATQRQAIEQRIAEIESDQTLNARAKAAALGEQRRELAKLADIQQQVAKETAGPQVQPGRTITPAADQADRQAAWEKQRFLNQRDAEARKTELDRQIDQRAEAILKAAQAVGVSLDKAAAVIQARSEITAEQSNVSRSSAAELIKGFESFRSTPYFDVNALRAGYGSDTVTLSDGSIQRVTAGINVSVADANRDLERRIGEFQATIERQVGADTFRAITENQQAALTSIAYNYGSLPDRIVAAIKSGDAGTVSQAISGLGSDNGGINRGRRKQEAGLYLSDAPQGVQDRVSETMERAKAYADLVAQSREFTAEQALEGQALSMTERAAAALRYEQQLLNEARQAGIELSPDQITSIKTLAGEMADAEDKTRRLAQSQQDLKAAAQEFASVGKGVTKGFISDLMSGKSAAEALTNALQKVADVLLDQVLDSLFQVKGAGAGGTSGGGLFGGLGGLLSKIFSYDGGGYTGDGPRSGGLDGKGGQLALVHPQETVVDHTKQRTRSAPAAAGGASAVHVTSEVAVRFEEDGTFHAYVEKTSAKQADKRVKRYDANLPGRVQAIERQPRRRSNTK